MKNTILLIIGIIVLAGCTATTGGVTTTNPLAGGAPKQNINQNKSDFASLAIELIDIEYAVVKAVEDFLDETNSIKPEGGRWVTQLSQITNDTPVNLDVRTLTEQLKRKLRRSGRFIFTAATGDSQTSTLSDQRALSESDLFDQSTVAGSGTVIAPELSIEGGILTNIVTSTNQKKQRVSYIFALSVIDIDTGLIIFDSYNEIKKTGSNQNFSW